MSIDDKCLYKPTLMGKTENTYKCYGCIWIEYGCPDYEPKRELQLDIFRRQNDEHSRTTTNGLRRSRIELY
jgi:hypothetical protein